MAVLCSQFLYSQSTRLDSINISAIEKDIRIENPYINFFNRWTFQQHLLTLNLENRILKEFSLRKKMSNYNFESKGVYQLNPKVVISGNLKINREHEDNVPFVLTDERTTNTSFIHNPSYYWAPHAAKWMKQNYLINGQVAYRPVKFLITQLGTEGNFSKAYRQDADPRPEVSTYQYKIFGKVGFSWNKHSLLEREDISIIFRRNNIVFVNNNTNVPSNDSIFIRYNEGYGNQYNGLRYGLTEYKVNGYVWGGEYAFNTSNIHISIGYDYVNAIERFYRIYEYQAADLSKYRIYEKYSGLKTDLHSFISIISGNFQATKWPPD